MNKLVGVLLIILGFLHLVERIYPLIAGIQSIITYGNTYWQGVLSFLVLPLLTGIVFILLGIIVFKLKKSK